MHTQFGRGAAPPLQQRGQNAPNSFPCTTGLRPRVDLKAVRTILIPDPRSLTPDPRPMASIFSKIVAGEIPCHKVWEDERHLAFLDINPCVAGHTLVIPRAEHEYLFDMPQHDYAALMSAAKTVAGLLKERLGCSRVCVSVVGYEVPHVHVHLIPTMSLGDIPIPPPMAEPGDLAAIAARISGTGK